MSKGMLDGIIFKIDNGYPLLKQEYEELIRQLPVIEKEEYIGDWSNGKANYRNVEKIYYVVGNEEKGYFRFYYAKSEWVVSDYFDIKRVQRKSKEVTETRVWYE